MVNSATQIVKKLCILGSTGSIGQSTLDVVRLHPDRFKVISLSANASAECMFKQCKEFLPEKVVMVSSLHAKQLSMLLTDAGLDQVIVLSGKTALEDIARCPSSDTVMAAIVGFSGLLPTMSAIKAGKRVLLANKEALVTSGQIFIDAVKESGAQLLPIDSEHNAIFQCLPLHVQQETGFCQLNDSGINKLLLTGSGGPF